MGVASVIAVVGLAGGIPVLSQTVFAVAAVSVCASGCDYTTIQDGIDHVDSGGIVNVSAGTYAGNNINVNKAVTINGAPGAIVTVPDGASNNGFDVWANDVTIQGLDIEGPASSSYLTYAWGGNVTRGIAVHNGVTNFTITDNTIKNLRNDVLIDGRNTGSVTNNIIDNSKSGISVQYTDAGAGNTEGYAITMSGNSEGAYGNEWGLNTHLNGHYVASTYYSNSQKIAATAPDTVQQSLLANSAANGGWTVQDQGYSTANRTAVTVDTAGSDSSQGSKLGPLATIPGGIAAVISGGKVHVNSGTYTMNSANTVNKQVDIEGQSGATINTSGGAQILTFTAPGSKLNGFAITKTDKTSQNIIGIQANNTTVSNNSFTGQYSIGDGEVARALEVSTTTGSAISENTITGLRQPAYINDNAAGEINDNYVSGTKGWVLVANSNFSFTGNTWGTNATDIAIIDNDANPSTPITNNYTCSVMNTIRTNNNNPSIDNQVLTSPCPITEAPGNLTPPDGTVTTDPAFVNTWTTVADATKYEYQTSHSKNGTSLGPIIYSDDSTGSNYSVTSGLVTRHNNGTPDGVYYWRVRALNSAGDPGPWSTISKVTVDTNNPAAPTLLTPSNNTYKNTNDFYFTWSDSSDSGSPVTYEFIASQNGHTTGGVLDTGVWNNILNGNAEQKTLTSPQIHSTGAGDGTWYWQVRAMDAAGNKSGWSTVWHVTLDTHAPAAPALTSPANNSVVNGGSVTQSWSDSSSDVDHYIYESYNNSSATSLRFRGTYTATSKTATNVAETTYWWRVKAVDKAGNESGWSPLWKITVDNTAPDVAITAPTGSTLRGTVTISGTVTDDNPDHYYLVVKDSHGHVVAGPGTVYAANVADYHWNTTGVADDTYTIDLEARDAAGNKDSGSVATKVVTVDNTAPSTPSATPDAGNYVGTQSVSLSSNDSGSGIAHIYYTTDGSTPSNASTEYTSPISVTQDQTVKAIAYDNAGNVSPVMTAVYGIAPVISGEGSVDVTTTSITLVWTTNQPATSRVVYDTVAHPTAGSAPNYGYAFSTAETDTSPKVTSHSVTISGLTPGTTYYFRTVSHGSPESISDELSSITKLLSSGSTPIFQIIPTLTIATTTGGGGGTVTAVGGGTGGNGAQGQVLGATTNTPNTTDSQGSKSKGSVKGIATTTDAEQPAASKAFLGLGWWWLAILAALGALYAAYRRTRDRGETA